ncbi:hypothetical protein DMP07_06395 [Slackia faecicanis]|uniref:Type II toxin-antitoxin system antitoxin, RelB/DinJ family n=1 Tax=Slackia faecicanis TaxID=255723 RepID=A0A3N0AEM1_9ACTN|nr:hypothetical protein [Slackia faecicanis]RNL19602.1 hypothetical protein DMP07_06395 [Slackia faecicanis]
MDAVVTARVPVEVKEHGARVLRSIGATPTQLVNAAYSYVLETGALPCAHAHDEADPSGGRSVKTPTPAQRDALRVALDSMTCEVPESFWQGCSYKELLEEGRRADYEALA